MKKQTLQSHDMEKIPGPSPPSQQTQSSYLFRYWQPSEDGPVHYMLRSITTDEQHLFRDLPELVAFLRAKSKGQSG